MNIVYSNIDDCFELAKLLNTKLGNKIQFHSINYPQDVSGQYFSTSKQNDAHCSMSVNGLPFYYKFCKEGFLSIQIASNYMHNNSMGEKLAALSNFYKILSETYGEPTLFYTTKDNGGTITLHWSFVNKEETIQKFRDGHYYVSAEIDKLIIFDEPETNNVSLNNTTRKWINTKIGLPIELLGLVNENIDDYIKYKSNKASSTLKEKNANPLKDRHSRKKKKNKN